MKAETEAADVGIDRFAYQRVARRGPYALAYPVEKSQKNHVPACGRERGNRSGETSDNVTGQREGFSLTERVAQPSRIYFQDTRCALSQPVHQADIYRRCRRGNETREKYGQKRVDHLGRHVVEKADDSEEQDVPVKRPF